MRITKDEIWRSAMLIKEGGVYEIARMIERYEREIEWLTQRNDALRIIEEAGKVLNAWVRKERNKEIDEWTARVRAREGEETE